MRLFACSLVLVAACTSGTDDDYPVEPGGGSGTFGNTVGQGGSDGGTPDGSGRSGRVCGLSEILAWDECDPIGLDGLMVTVGAANATTAANGTFTIAEPTGSDLWWRVFGNAQLPSLREFPSDNTIPSIRLAQFQDLAADSNVVIGNNVGTVFVQVLYNGAPVQDATASLAGSQDLVYYDDRLSPSDFSLGMTHEAGLVWFPNVTPGNAVTFTVTPPAAIGAPKDTVVRVEAETATFATVVFQSASQ